MEKHLRIVVIGSGILGVDEKTRYFWIERSCI